MMFRPLNLSEDIERVFGWLSCPDVADLFDFGDRPLSKLSLRVILSRPGDVFWIFSSSGDHSEPIGLVALSKISQRRGCADLWIVIGETQNRARGYGRQAISTMTEHAFSSLHINMLHAFIAAPNTASIATFKSLGWQFTGVQRAMHLYRNSLVDRILISLARSEHASRVKDPASIFP